MAACVTPDSLTPVISFSRIFLDSPVASIPEELLVTVEIVIQEPDTGNPLDSFLDDGYLNQHLKIRLFQITDPWIEEQMIGGIVPDAPNRLGELTGTTAAGSFLFGLLEVGLRYSRWSKYNRISNG